VTDLCAEERTVLRSQLEKSINTPLTSSMGRLFDAVSSLAGVRQKVNYEAQAAMELEALANPDEKQAYPFGIPREAGVGIIDPLPMLNALLADIQAGKSKDILSARFHNGVAMMVVQACQVIRNETGINEIALSGGVWQNMTLFQKTLSSLQKEGFRVYFHQQVPTNDGGLALGQAVMAFHKIRRP
jgi:hydrogenase maturation protein HypF